MRKTTLALAAAMAMTCAQTEAAVYTFKPTAIGPATGANYFPAQAAFTISIADTVVQAGSFNYDYRYRYLSAGNSPQIIYQPTAIGDVQALKLFQGNNGAISFVGGNGPRGSGSDYFHVDLIFSTSGQVTSGALTYADDAYNIQVASSSSTFNGSFGTGPQAQSSISAALVGGFSSVPEPATLGLLSASLALIGVRRRGRQTVAAMSNAE